MCLNIYVLSRFTDGCHEETGKLFKTPFSEKKGLCFGINVHKSAKSELNRGG